MSSFRPDLSWSKSRDGTLADCARRYFYHYYGWIGWSDPGADPRAREIFLLKHLRSRYMWLGEVVHEVVEGILRGLRAGQPQPPIADLLDQVRKRMRADFRASRERRFREESRPGSVALFEHDYGRRVSDSQWRQIAEQADACMKRFFESPAFARILKMDPHHDWLELEDLQSFVLDGVKVFVKLDFAHRQGEDAVVVDWKTGKSNTDNRLQFGCYVLYGARKWGLPAERVTGLEVNLATGREREHRFSAADLAEVEATILRSIARMRELLRDPQRNLAHEADFPMNPEARRCSNCNFLKICPEGESLGLIEESAARAVGSRG